MARALSVLSLLSVLCAWWIVGDGPPRTPKDAYPALVAGDLWLRGEEDAIYVASTFRRPGPEWVAARERVGAAPRRTTYLYSPALLPLYGGLRLLGVTASGLGLLMWLANGLAVVALAHAVVARAGRSARWLLPVSLALALPVITRSNATLGQNTLVLAAVFVHLASRPGALAAAVNGAVSAQLKPWAPVLAVSYAYQRRWRECAAFLVGGAACTLVLGALAGPELLWAYLEVARELSSTTVLRPSNLAVHGFAARWVHPDWLDHATGLYDAEIGPPIRALGFAFAGGVALLGARASTRSTAPLVALLVALFVPSVTWVHYAAIALPLAIYGVLTTSGPVRWIHAGTYGWLALAANGVWALPRSMAGTGRLLVVTLTFCVLLGALVAHASARTADERVPTRA